MATTTNKGYTAQATGDNVDTWGDVLNNEALQFIDDNLGGVVSLSLTNSNVVLSASQSRALVVRCNGTLSANVSVETVASGFTLVENNTSGAFTLTFGNSLNKVTIPQGTSAVVATNPTGGVGTRKIADNAAEFASGTKLTFHQAAAPTGWVADTNPALNHAIRIVPAGSGGGSGGSVPFTSAFVSQAVAGTVQNTQLSISQIPSHRHFSFNVDTSSASPLNAAQFPARLKNDSYNMAGTATDATVGMTSSQGGDQAHNHGFTGTAINLAVSYLTLILCTKS
jgi:hypothetical protein